MLAAQVVDKRLVRRRVQNPDPRSAPNVRSSIDVGALKDGSDQATAAAVHETLRIIETGHPEPPAPSAGPAT